MPSSEYTIGCLSLFNISNAATHLGMTNVAFPANVEVSDDGSGSLYAEHQSITSMAPVATITTKCLQTLMSFIGLNGQCVKAGLDVSKVDIVNRKMENCDVTLSGTPHERLRCTKGLLRLGTLSLPRGQDATITAMLDTLADGSNAPVAKTDGVALPSPVVSERHTLGLCAFGNIVFPKLEEVSLEFNIQIDEKLPAEASLWPETAGVLTVRPVVTFRGRDLSKITDAIITAGAVAAAHTNTVIQIVKRKSAGAFEDFDDPVHTRITLAGLLVPEDFVSVAAAAKATNALRLQGAFDGSNAPVLIDLTSTYDTSPPT